MSLINFRKQKKIKEQQFVDFKQKEVTSILIDLEAVNKYVGTPQIDDKIREFTNKYPNFKLDFGLNTNKFYVCNRFGTRVL